MLILNDFATSVEKALEEIDPRYKRLPGLVICGTHTPNNTEELLDKITKARKSKLPFLGICFGYQLAAIEYARNVLKIYDATSEEFDSSGTFVVKKRHEPLIGLHGGESYWSYFDVAIKTEFPENFLVVPYHPEYQSSKDNPHPVLVEFIKKCKAYKRYG